MTDPLPPPEAILRSYGMATPRMAPSSWVAPGAVVVGDVEIGEDSSIWYGAVVRGDVHRIRIGARSNIQDGAVVHVTRDRFPTNIGDEVTVGHRAVVHGCTVADGALIGIGAIVLDGARIGEGALIGAGAVVTPGFEVEAHGVALGIPARVVRRLADEERSAQRHRTLSYVDTARQHTRGRAVPGRKPE